MATKSKKTSWHGVVGQESIVRSLRDHIDGSLSSGIAMPHVLLAGASGYGKTYVSRAISLELGTRHHAIFCSPSTRRSVLAKALLELQKGDVLFLDEAHQAPMASIESLFTALDRKEAPAMEDGKIIEGEWRELPDWTLVLATNLPGKLPAAIKTRTPLQFILQPYSESELITIIRNAAASKELLLSAQCARRLAQAAHGSPRRANHLLDSVNVVLGDREQITRRMLKKHLRDLGIDDDNVGEPERRYLTALAQRGGAMSLHDLAMHVGTDEQSIRDDVEGFLVRSGWVAVESRGRCLTHAGLAYVAKRGLL